MGEQRPGGRPQGAGVGTGVPRTLVEPDAVMIQPLVVDLEFDAEVHGAGVCHRRGRGRGVALPDRARAAAGPEVVNDQVSGDVIATPDVLVAPLTRRLVGRARGSASWTA